MLVLIVAHRLVRVVPQILMVEIGFIIDQTFFGGDCLVADKLLVENDYHAQESASYQTRSEEFTLAHSRSFD